MPTTELFQSIHQFHRDIVTGGVPGNQPLAYTDMCEHQTLYRPKRFISVQGHPEFSEAITREILIRRNESKVVNDEDYSDAMQRVADSHDGVLIAKTFLRFLRE
jgi:GMP synthase-like glutamine amidotransferase